MTQENKELLLKDLCARLPYGVKVQTTYINPQTKERKDIGTDVLSTVEISLLIDGYYEHKPYLFPLESMTEEQRKELFYLSGIDIIYGKFYTNSEFTLEETLSGINWLLKNHFDINGLIPMDLALDVTGLNIY